MGNNRVPTITPSDTARVRQSDPETSHQAADATQGSVAASQAAVLRLLRHGDHTDRDMEILLASQFSATRVRTARHELKERGLVESRGTVKQPGARTHRTLWGIA